MNKLELFKNEDFGEVRTIILDDEIWFVGRDIAGILKYKEPHKAVLRHVEIDDRMKYPIPDISGIEQDMWVINESGLYSLILSSKMKDAKKIKKWVTKDILPQIRKTGMYIPQPLLEKVAKHDVEIEGIKHFVNEEWRINYDTQVSINKIIKDRVYLRSETTGADKKKLFKSIYSDIQRRFGIKSYRDIKMLDYENVSNYVSAWIEPAYLKGDTKYAQSKLW